ncbi:MAG: hypothetical protein WC415_02145 [Patescibacteria group bacterium]|jgi:hypothetical protein
MTIDKKNKKDIPEIVEDYRNSAKAVENNVFISEKNGLTGNDSTKMASLISDLFRKNVLLTELIPKIKELFSFDDVKAKTLALDIVGLRLMVVKDWIGGIDDYMRSLGGNSADYEKNTNEEIASVKKEKEEWLAEETANKKYEVELLAEAKQKIEVAENDIIQDVDPKKEKRDCDEIFNSNIAGFLSTESPYIINTVNNVLLEILAGDKGFAYRDQLFRALLSNEEKITTAPFVLEKKSAFGTIGNWLKDFIEQKGSGIFDNIVLGDFLLKSVNAKKLNDEDRELVKKLLILYRNLKFFPDSMPNEDGVDWQIIPFEKEEETGDLSEAKARLEKEKEIINQPAVERAKKIAELKTEADRYDSRGLERKMIEEEIKKLE